MSDLSTREQIRGEAIDRIARVLFEADAADACSDAPYEDWAPRYRRKALPFVDALGDLLPTSIEWGVRYEAPDITPRMDNPGGISTHTRTLPNEAHVRAAVANGAPIRVTNRRAVSRYAHDWTEEDA